MKRIGPIALIAGILGVLAAGCIVDSRPQQTSPPVVNNIITPSDSGPMVMAVGAGLLLLIAVGVGVWLYRDRKEAKEENTAWRALAVQHNLVTTLNGQPVRPALTQSVRVPRGHPSVPMLESGME